MKHFKIKGEHLKKAPQSFLLYHQYRTLEELKNNSVIFNTYPTGAGKTRASLQYIKENKRSDVLFIAPTNELLNQHSQDIEEFINDNDLNHIVVKIDAAVIEKLRNHRRKGSTLYELLRNPLDFKEILNIKEKYIEEKRPCVVVVNPDIFYYCLYSLYGNLDKWNLMEKIIKKFNYIVIDEFHYYDSKQLMNFLFFIILSKKLGYFEGRRKICILTATPDKLIEQYLKRGKIDYKIVSPENEIIESENYEEIKTLSELDLYITNKSIDEIVIEEYKHNSFEKDSVVISQSIYRVNKIKEQLIKNGIKKEYIGVITGAIRSKERKRSVEKALILATPTVDIGYNFKKEGKEKQNIEIVITEANTSDQALQRIGRAGRILGKKIQSEKSKVILCVNDTIYENFKESDIELTRNELKELIKNTMPERNIMKKYIENNGILEMCFPLSEIYTKMHYKERIIIENMFNEMVEVFAPKKNHNFKSKLKIINDYKKKCLFLSEYNKSLNKDKKITELDDKTFVEFIKECYVEKGIEEILEEDDLQEFTEKEKNMLKVDLQNESINYLNSEVSKIKALINFRGMDISKGALVFDKYYKFSQETQIFVYDIFHLMRYYKLEWYNSKKSWEKACNIRLSEDEIQIHSLKNIDTYVIVQEIRETPIQITWEYFYDGIVEGFEQKFVNKVEGINNLILVAYEKTKIGMERVMLPEDITNAFKKEYTPIFIISQNPREEYRIRKIIKNQPIFLQKLKVNFEESIKEYYMITGTNSIMVDSEMIKVKNKAFKEEFFIC
ncbi:MAG: type I-D CRISPR-associated helicase Cas3' [Tepidibacter sp.]|jgi:CRISPR-associated endonuclease/helicase Cas3|uniref:type I-D CRISPR-associated helicase Cas3' n=1 Tax=Tepidibacter sp. TaxID=2529387 RepID=UPI0025FC937F|nr:type I-D CRISPR-associated helicase Cas3' [Tepidibacter sp.]MCT4509902.1 type I-D CRISPR-associated helicase Cas3' [Tepidibacter sp.]